MPKTIFLVIEGEGEGEELGKVNLTMDSALAELDAKFAVSLVCNDFSAKFRIAKFVEVLDAKG